MLDDGQADAPPGFMTPRHHSHRTVGSAADAVNGHHHALHFSTFDTLAAEFDQEALRLLSDNVDVILVFDDSVPPCPFSAALPTTK